MRQYPFFLILALPGFLAAQSGPKPLLADFDHGQYSIVSAPLHYEGLTLSMDEASPFTVQGQSVRLRTLGGAKKSFISLNLAPRGSFLGETALDFNSISRSQNLVVVWKASQSGTQCQICLEEASWPGTLCATLTAKDMAWHEDNIAFAGAAPSFAKTEARTPLKVGRLVLRPLPAAGASQAEILVDELRLDPPAADNSTSTVARAFGASEAKVNSLRRHGLPDGLNWMLLLMQERCGCTVESLLQKRASKSWGEIAQSAGWEWGALVREQERRAAAAGLTTPVDSLDQQDKVARNNAFVGVRP